MTSKIRICLAKEIFIFPFSSGIYQQDSLNGPARLFLEWTQPNGWVDAPYDSFSSDGKIYAYLFHHFESGFLTSIKVKCLEFTLFWNKIMENCTLSEGGRNSENESYFISDAAL